MSSQTVICFGEMLWDLLPSGKVPGGAPMNVAVHLHNLGVDARMVSKVGRDPLGAEILAFLHHKGVNCSWVQEDPIHPTGVVKVQIDPKGFPSYEIVENVAWDYIQPDEQVEKIFEEPATLVYGSLASRNSTSFQTLLQILPKATLRVFDVNLRAPYFSTELLDKLLLYADIVKMNDEELDVVTFWFQQDNLNEQQKMQFLLKKFELQSLIITKGEHGALLLDEDEFFVQKGFRVEVNDTIGSGDSFLAAFLSKYLEGESQQDCLAFAGAAGALVATKAGGTPEIDLQEIQALLDSPQYN